MPSGLCGHVVQVLSTHAGKTLIHIFFNLKKFVCVHTCMSQHVWDRGRQPM